MKKVYTPEELALRDGKRSSEIWVAYQGKIYNVTSSPLFKNGKHYRHEAGKDLTEAMRKAPHLDEVMDKFPVVGTLIA